jgi:hypothetical protein
MYEQINFEYVYEEVIMIDYKLIDITGNVIGTITLKEESIPNLIMDDVEFLLGGSFVPGENKFLNFIVVPVPVKEKVTDISKRQCCNLNKTRGPNTDGKMVCPIHCSKCGHNRKYEGSYDFCSLCRIGDPCK